MASEIANSRKGLSIVSCLFLSKVNHQRLPSTSRINLYLGIFTESYYCELRNSNVIHLYIIYPIAYLDIPFAFSDIDVAIRASYFCIEIMQNTDI